MTIRRAITGAVAAASNGVGVATVGVVVTWVASRVVTDRVGWSQYAWWVPSLAWAGACVVGLAAWWGLAWLHRRLIEPGGAASSDGAVDASSAGRRRKGVGRCSLGRCARLLASGLVVAMLARAGVLEWRLYRFVAPGAGPDAGAIRIASWNPALPVDSLEPLLATDADVYVVANEWSPSVVGEFAGEVGGEVEIVRSERMTVVSRLPVRRWGSTYLGLAGRVLRKYQFTDIDAQVAERVDQGRAMFVELDTPQGPFVVWLVDLPSDPRLVRTRVTATAADAVRSFEGRVYRFDEDGGRVVERLRGGFPEADVIVGDFNIPRGSASLGALVGEHANAFDQAGRGYGATFPRERPLAQIDQMFVGPGWRAVRYRVFDPGAGLHLAQVGEVVRR